MTVVETAPNGVVNSDTTFTFLQQGHQVSATYSGGRILLGFLVGTLDGHSLSFSFCQLEHDGSHGEGRSACDLSVEDGKLQMVERFTWGSGHQSSGVNVFREL